MYSEEILKSKPVEELVKIILEQGSELELTVNANSELTAQVETLSKNASDVKAANGPSKETFEVDGSEYGFKKVRIDHRGKIITAAEVLESEKLQEELVKIKSGMIYLIEENAG